MASPWSCFHRRFHSPSAQARFGPVRFARYWFSWMDGCCPPYVSMEPMWLVRGCVRRTDGVCSGPKGRLRHARLAAAAVLLSLGVEVIEVTLKGRGAFRRAWEEKWETSITTWSCAASIRWLATWQHQTPAPPWHGPLEVALRVRVRASHRDAKTSKPTPNLRHGICRYNSLSAKYVSLEGPRFTTYYLRRLSPFVVLRVACDPSISRAASSTHSDRRS